MAWFRRNRDRTDYETPETDAAAQPTRRVAPETDAAAQPTTRVAPERDAAAQPTRRVAPETDASAQPNTRIAPEADAAAPPRKKLGAQRALATLLGAGVAGLLIWLATQIGTHGTGDYWATYGLVAAAGLMLALSQLVGGWTKGGAPAFSPLVFLFGFLPTLVAGGWVLVAQQPTANSFSRHVVRWSSDIGVLGVVHDLGNLLAPIAFGIGLVFGYVFDTTGPRMRYAQQRYAQQGVERTRVAPAPMDRRAADEPVTAEQAAVVDDDRRLARTTAPDDTA
jgi:hypothetical protein